MPPEYVKGPGKVGHLHSHWRKSVPDDEEDADGRGKVVQVPDALRLYGVWRRVPGFWKILASDEGFIATEGEWRVRTLSVGIGNYMTVWCNGTPEKVHLLVGRAFHGRPMPDQVSVDHIGGKELPMSERRQDNRATNLRWATAAEQAHNRRKNRKVQSSGEPCLVWKVQVDKRKNKLNAHDMASVVGTEQRFPSVTTAAKALGLNGGNLGNILNKKTRLKTAVNAKGTRYTGRWDPDLVDLDGEEWKEKEKSSGHRLLISNYGRLQRIYPGGREGTKHYSDASDGDYASVRIDGKQKRVYVLVGELFFIGPKPRNWACWDHKNRDKQDNHIGNLRPVTREENGVNTARQRDFYLWPVDNPDHWVRCESQSATARAYGFDSSHLCAVLHKRPKHGYFQKTVGGYCAAFCDEVDES